MPTVLITGANRGIGREFVRQYAGNDWTVIATCRQPDKAVELKMISPSNNIYIRRMDITNMTEIAKVADEFEGKAIDVLINNAGISGPLDSSASFGHLDIQAWLNVLYVDAIAPLKVTEAFFDQIKSSERKTIVFISSRAGSIAERGLLPHHKRGGGGPYIYRSSKAALNAAAQSLAFDLIGQGIGVLVLHPGYVKTDMAGPDAILDPESSVSSMRQIIDNFSPIDNGVFRNYTGEVIPW